jgi:hypothetical protein
MGRFGQHTKESNDAPVACRARRRPSGDRIGPSRLAANLLDGLGMVHHTTFPATGYVATVDGPAGSAPALVMANITRIR